MNYSLPGSLLKMFLTSASSPAEEAWCSLNGFTLSLPFSYRQKIQINCTNFSWNWSLFIYRPIFLNFLKKILKSFVITLRGKTLVYLDVLLSSPFQYTMKINLSVVHLYRMFCKLKTVVSLLRVIECLFFLLNNNTV